MRRFLTLVAIVSVLTTACENRQQSPPSQQRSSGSPRPQPTPPTEAPGVPSDVSYSIIDSSTVAGIKRSLDIRLNKKVSEETLRALALRLKAQDSHDYERTFIAYYLPGMTVGAGAWATTHFNRDLEVRILGLTAEEEKKLAAEPVPTDREVIGRWLDESPLVGSRITIFREDGELYIEQKFRDGSSLKKELIEKQSPLGRRFDKPEGSSAGDHWLIDARGNLQIRDNDGLIRTAKKIE